MLDFRKGNYSKTHIHRLHDDDSCYIGDKVVGPCTEMAVMGMLSSLSFAMIGRAELYTYDCFVVLYTMRLKFKLNLCVVIFYTK